MHKLILFILLVISVSAHAESNDTYNFYFQKAPGPVTVNQGSAQSTPPVPVVAPPAAGAPAAGASVNAVPADEPSPARKRWRVYAAYSELVPGTIDDRSMGLRNNLSDMDQYSLGAAYEINSVVAPYAELSYLWNLPNYYASRGYQINGADQRFDFGAGVKLTPIRIGFGKGYGVSLGGLLGYNRLPTIQDAATLTTVNLDHAWSPVLGAELSFAFADTFSLGLQVKRITKFDADSGSFVLAYFL